MLLRTSFSTKKIASLKRELTTIYEDNKVTIERNKALREKVNVARKKVMWPGIGCGCVQSVA